MHVSQRYPVVCNPNPLTQKLSPFILLGKFAEGLSLHSINPSNLGRA